MKLLNLIVLLAMTGGGIWLLQPAQRPTLVRWTSTVEQRVGSFAAPLPPAPQLSRYETMLCNLANAERKKRGLPLLKINPTLAAVARGHSRDMMQKSYFSHVSPTKGQKTVTERYVLKFHHSARLVAENIYMLKGPSFYRLTEADFRRAHEGWMKSPGHRANILRVEPADGPTQIGVGIVVKNGAFWATQNFARPML